MLYALKGNKEVVIDDSQKDEYVEKGFTISEFVDGDLTVIAPLESEKVDNDEVIAKLEQEIVELKANAIPNKGTVAWFKLLLDALEIDYDKGAKVAELETLLGSLKPVID